MIEEHDVDLIVISLPLHTSGQEGTPALREPGAWVGKETGIPSPITTSGLHRRRRGRLLAAGIKRQGRKERRDMLAAQILLQDFLDAGCPAEDVGPSPLADA